ncbi:cytochrome P450 [Nocardioides acrostichi]|uniref:Cytochrome P450 n=1 Tax=Nocardioides acrostichi TaxID=2784339 RepID=A0A930UYZ3_9ACTN|nr:cytochrome P450 [Nocardioides acrostichi]MBF4161620.1 cytochrome P450 [Nocardioides acrostichi]
MSLVPVYDPSDSELDASPYETWKWLRDERPVYFNDERGFYALSRYDDVAAALKDTEAFSSAYGTVLELLTPERQQTGMMINSDPPSHTRLRKLVSRVFTTRRVSDLEPKIREIAESLLAAWTPGEEFDFVQQFAAQIPSRVIAELLGVPSEEREEVRLIIDTAFHLEGDEGFTNPTAVNAILELAGYLQNLLERRRTEPIGDLFSDLAATDLTAQECVEFGLLLVIAGTETVGRLLGWACILLDAHPDQRAWLVENPDKIGQAVEEVLRYEGPSPVQARRATRDLELHGVTIPQGSPVLLLNTAAGRDERKYGPDAEEFDVRREPEHHLSFGYGVHFCLGASLARLESRIALETVLRTHPTWTVDHDRSQRAHTSTVRGWEHVWVR